MTPGEQAVARELVACGAWEWMPGMLTWAANPLHALRVCEVRGRVPNLTGMMADCEAQDVTGQCFPDLTDHATIGCLAALARKVWGPLFTVHVIPPLWDEPWGCYVRHSGQGMEAKGLIDPNWKGWVAPTEGTAWARAIMAKGE